MIDGAYALGRAIGSRGLWGACVLLCAVFGTVSPARGMTTNLLINSGFEVTTAEAMPDFWGPSYDSWGTRVEQWAAHTDSWRERWHVDRTVRHSGTNALRIDRSLPCPTAAELIAVANETPMESNRIYTLSVWLRSSQANLPVLLQVQKRSSSVANISVKTPAMTNTWERYSLTVVPASTSDQYSCLVIPAGNGTLWVDDVQLEVGAVATPWSASPKDAGIETQTVHKDVPEVPDRIITPGRDSVTSGIDSVRRCLLVDGQPFIPMAIGWDGTPSSNVVQYLAKAGFNSIVPFLRNQTTGALRSFLDNANANGLKVIPCFLNNVSTNTIVAWISGLKSHPAVIVWYVYDEPVNPAGSETWLEAKEKYQLAKKLDPGRPAMVNVMGEEEYVTHGWASDILSMDYYPIGRGPSCTIPCFRYLEEILGSSASYYKKPRWSWIQSMGYSFFHSREPTGAEAECMAYLALVHGSSGLLYFYQQPRMKEQWDELRLLNHEIRELTPVLCSTDTPLAVSSGASSVHVLSKSYGGTNYVIAVNESPLPVTEAKLTSSQASSASAAVLFEGRTVNVVNGTITDTFAGYQRHVYAYDKILQ